MAGNFFRGTTVEQDGRFGKADEKLISKMTKEGRFSPVLTSKIEFKKVNIDLMTKWITDKITNLLGSEDDIVIGLLLNLLEKDTDGKKVQLELTGFLAKDTGTFMEELWTLLLDAQQQPSGIPQVFIESKKKEILERRGAIEEKVVLIDAVRGSEMVASHGPGSGGRNDTAHDDDDHSRSPDPRRMISKRGKDRKLRSSSPRHPSRDHEDTRVGSRDNGRDRDRDRDNGRNEDRARNNDGDRDRVRDNDRDRDRARDNGRNGDRARDYGRDRDRGRDRDNYRRGENIQDRESYRDRRNGRDRGSYNDNDRDNDRDKERSRDPHRQSERKQRDSEVSPLTRSRGKVSDGSPLSSSLAENPSHDDYIEERW